MPVTQLGPGASHEDVGDQPGQLGALLPTSLLRAPKGQMLVKFHLNLRRASLETGGNWDARVKWVRAGRTLQPSGPDAGGVQSRPRAQTAPGCLIRSSRGLLTSSQNSLLAWPLDGLAPGSQGECWGGQTRGWSSADRLLSSWGPRGGRGGRGEGGRRRRPADADVGYCPGPAWAGRCPPGTARCRRGQTRASEPLPSHGPSGRLEKRVCSQNAVLKCIKPNTKDYKPVVLTHSLGTSRGGASPPGTR